MTSRRRRWRSSAVPLWIACLLGMRAAVSALARSGNNVIVDDVLIDDDGSAYREALAGLDVLWVGVIAPRDVIEARERQRGDRDIGLARWQFPARAPQHAL